MLSYTPDVLTKGARGVFIDALTGAEKMSLVPLLATVIDSNGNNEVYTWLGESPQMADLTKKELEFTPLQGTSYTITNNVYAAALAIKRTDLDDDQVGGIKSRIAQLATVAVAHKNKLLMNLLINGDDSTLGKCYTGAAFFNNSHTARGDSGTQDNIISGSGTTTTQVAADFNDALTQMMSFKAENGEPFHEDISELTICAPLKLRKPVLEMIKGTGDTINNNQFDGLTVKTVFSARLTADDANDWYLLNTGKALRPLLIQDRNPLEFAALEDGNEVAFLREIYLYKARWRGAPGYGFWQDAVKVTNS